MLIINGGIAMFNGLLLASYAMFCKHVLGGTCCGGVCECGEGKCCGDVWHTDSGLCCQGIWFPDGEVTCLEGEFFAYNNPCCCACLEGEPGDEFCCEPGIPIHVKQDGECKQRCCEAGGSSPTDCTDEYPADCTHTSQEGSCLVDGCDTACCAENAEGTEMACVDATVPSCVYPSVSNWVGAFGNTKVACGVNACHGQCCKYIDDEYTATGVMSLADCIASGGEFQGVNTTFCLSCYGDTGFTGFRCRLPFDECCCEEKTSTGAGLVFTAPRNKQRSPPLDVGKAKQVTIELQTESDILIHGNLVTTYAKCNLTFLVCHDELNVEPVPCGSNFTNLSIKVCWADQASDREDLVFPECQGMTIWLGNCESATEEDHCTTYTTYRGGGLASDADIVLYGDARITANGAGPLVISEPVTNQGTCARTLTLDGTSTQLNSINGGITDVPGGEKLTLVKEGVGTWRLGASSSFEGQTLIKQGTIIAGVSTGPSGSGVFGQGVSQATLPMVGDSSDDATGFAAMLLEDGVVLNRSLQVAALGLWANQIAILGGSNTSGTSTFAYNTEIRIGRDVTLQCATGGTVDFGNVWLDSTGTGSPAFSYAIGTAGNLGTVRLSNPLATTSGSVSINYGTLVTGADDQIAPTTPLSIGTETSTATLNLDGTSLTHSALTLIGSGSFITNTGSGALTMTSPATITVQSGTGHEISSNMVLASNLTVDVASGATLLISGDISGAFTLTKTGCGTLTLTGTNTVTIVNNGATLTPMFGAVAVTADGFTVQITNYDLSYTWAGTATASGTVVVSGTGLVTVTGVAADTSSTATITTSKANTADCSADVTSPYVAQSAANMSMVTVGNAGNAADTTSYGAVPYRYKIGAYDVTGSQYTEFLNAVGSTDTFGLYDADMGTDPNSYGYAQISQSGSFGSYTYAVMNGTGNRPITFVSWFDCARFANWMSNGRPSGAQNDTTTENGAYNLNGAASGNNVSKNATNPNTGLAPTFWIPLENEWYKAAYYSPNYGGSGIGGYYAFATQSNSAPGTTIGGSANQANYNNAIGRATDVGSFSGSGSFYGTFDQSGNVFQWNDLDGTGDRPSRGLRGGYWFNDSGDVSSSYRDTIGPGFGYGSIGFRLASFVAQP